MIGSAQCNNSLDKFHVCRDALMNPFAIRCIAPLAYFLLVVPFATDAADPSPGHPSVVITVASIDRVLDRGVLMTASAGHLLAKDQLIPGLMKSSHHLPPEGIDVDKPFAIVLFSPIVDVVPGEPATANDDATTPRKDKADCEPKDDDSPAKSDDDHSATKSDGDDAEAANSSSDLFDRLLDRIGLEWSSAFDHIEDLDRMVVIVPIMDFDLAMAFIEATAVADHSNRFVFRDGQEFTARRIGDYLVCGGDADRVAVCSDLQAVAPALVESNDLVITLKSMPAEMRAKRAEALQRDLATLMGFDDEESPLLTALVKTATAVSTEWIDLTALQVDEIRVSLRVDPERKQIISELDVAGPPNGKLAQAAHDWAPQRRFMRGIEDSNGPIAFHFAFQIPARHSKPIAEALANFAENPECDAMTKAMWYLMNPLVRGTIGLIKSGDFEVACSCIESNNQWVPLLGLKFPGGTKFPTTLQSMLLTFASDDWIELKKNSVEGVPVHRIFFKEIAEMFGAFGKFDPWCWLSVTADAVWLSAMLPDDLTISDRLRAAIKLKSSKPKTSPPAEPADHAYFCLSLHLHHFTGFANDSSQTDNDAAKVRQTDLKDDDDDEKPEKPNSPFRGKADGLIAVLSPSPTGFHLKIQWDEAFLTLAGQEILQNLKPEEDD
jgi:hypothetical protein